MVPAHRDDGGTAGVSGPDTPSLRAPPPTQRWGKLAGKRRGTGRRARWTSAVVWVADATEQCRCSAIVSQQEGSPKPITTNSCAPLSNRVLYDLGKTMAV